MSLKTTVALLALAGALVLGWTVFLRGGAGSEGAGRGPLFPDLLAAEVQTIRIDDRTRDRLADPVTLRRGPEGTWSLECPAIDGGRPVRARREAVETVVEAVRALVPLGVLEAGGSAAAAGFGQGQGASLRVERSGRPPLEVEFGAEYGSGQVVCRRGGDPTFWLVAREARKSAVPLLASLEDAALLDVPFLDVERILIEGEATPPVELERRFDRWWQVRPVDVRADDRKADEIRNTILDVKVLKRLHGPEARPDLVPDPPRWKITLGVRGRKEPVRMAVGQEIPEGVAVRLEGEAAIKIVHPGLLPVLEGTKDSLRDPHLLSVPRSEISAIRVRKQGRTLLDLRRNGKEFTVHFPEREGVWPRDADPVAAGRFLERLASLTFANYVPRAAPFEPALTVEIDRPEGPGGTTSALVMHFGAPDAGGMCPARVAGEEGSGAVKASDVAFLDDPFWKLLARLNRATTAYFKLARIKIRDSRDRSVTLHCRIDRAGENLKARVGEGAAAKDVPDSVLEPVTRKLVNFTVKEFIGEEPRSGMGLDPTDPPHLLVQWFEADDATAAGIPAEPKGREHELRVGPRQADGTYFARMDDDLGLVFLLEQSDLSEFFTVLENYAPK